LWQELIETTLYDKVCQLLTTISWFSPDTSVSNTTNLTALTIIYIKNALDLKYLLLYNKRVIA
jgi:hypothetical protein